MDSIYLYYALQEIFIKTLLRGPFMTCVYPNKKENLNRIFQKKNLPWKIQRENMRAQSNTHEITFIKSNFFTKKLSLPNGSLKCHLLP